MNRPSPREIDRRLNEAKLALEENKAYFSNPAKVVEELTALNVGDSGEAFVLISKLLDEVKVENYAGHHPPQVNYEPQGKGLELWAFTGFVA